MPFDFSLESADGVKWCGFVIGIAELDLDAHALQLAGDGAGGRICLTVGACVPPALVIGGLVPEVGYRHNNRAFGKYLGGFGESVLKLYSESNPSAREAIAEMFELVCNEPFDNWLDRVERSCDGFSKQKEVVREFDSPPEAIADALDSEGWTVSDDDVRNLGYLEIERETDLTGYDLVLTIDLRGKDMDSASDWMSAVRDLVYSWDPVEEALIAAGCPDAPSVDRIIEDFKSTYESSISGIEAVCQIVTSAWDEKTATDDIHSESLDQICEHASDAIDESASICVDMQLDSGVVR